MLQVLVVTYFTQPDNKIVRACSDVLAAAAHRTYIAES
ncbi:hypothetical protein SAMN05421784_1771 [Xenorhabdus koppenhoeferi]|uniref:Uncharacterized protein n=1 Tax=Xenorhabdus koppenhoeferi TaxID=351659 RepID=A0A1I7KLX0_9GAMM|nr:hypothetical protein SAMN05421784_1771 [Xenorhabdus koppenhoeferi]